MQKDREKLIDNTIKEDERSTLKKHADGMLRDFAKFNEHSSNRAIWELVQNACDLSKNCEIEIDYRGRKISFSHNGKAFTPNSLLSLVKQVSGKYGEEEDIAEVGKYGTGFLTTHTFGRKFIINSFLDTGDFYLPINDFVIDRRPQEWQVLSGKIADQKKEVYRLLKTKMPVSVNELKTTFTYSPEIPKEFEYIENSKKGLDDYIPLVFTINDRIKSIKIILDDELTNTYSFKEKKKIENDKGINLFQSSILKNGEEIHIYSIIDKEFEIEIILPINKNKEVFEFDKNIARLFYYYPLIGSENFGVNFIINCKNFLPTEPRDTIHLQSDNVQVNRDEKHNREIIDRSSSLIFSFLKSNVIEVKNPLLYTNVSFKTDFDDQQLLNKYFEDLQKEWNNNLNNLPFVKTINGYKSIQEVEYLSIDFLDVEDDVFDCFYELTSKFYPNIPVKEDIIRWSNNAINWNNDAISFIHHTDLLKKISECSLADFKKENLIKYYNYLLEIGKISEFNDLELFPNINGIFNRIGYLLKAENLNEKLIEIGEVLIPDSIAKLIHPDFMFSYSLSSFNRRNFSDEVKNSLYEEDFNDSILYLDSFNNEDYHVDLIESKTKIQEEYFKSLLNFCKLTNNIDSNSKPNQLLRIISKFYSWDENLIFLQKLSEDDNNIESRSIRKVLVKIFFNLIALHNNDWVEDKTEFLYDICDLYDDSYKDIYKESNIYPNQLFELHLSDNLKRDIGVTEDIKQFYKDVTGKNIDKLLVVKEFNDFLPKDNYINNKYLSNTIEEIIFQENINDIEKHDYGRVILKIIPKLTEKYYQELFQLLNEKKASIMMSVVSKEETKDDIFSIVMLDNDKIKNIGELVRSPNFEEILYMAIENLEDEKQHNANFQFKRQIGLHMEEKLKEHLKLIIKPEDIKCEIVGKQDGQDIVIKIKDDIKYYIEVKSRWDKKTSIKMSKNQTIRSNEQKDNYALCSVDMTNYDGDDRYEISDITKIIDNLNFVNDIGIHVEHLIKVLQQTNNSEEIHLDGEYRTLIPQKIIEEFGMNFNDFEKYLIDLLKNNENEKQN